MKRGYAAAIALAGLLVLAACGDDGTPSGGVGTPTPTPTQKTVAEKEWTITVPAGWTARDITTDADARKAVRYEGSDGRYVIVAIDPTGSDFAYDALWRYQAKDGRFEIVDKYDCAGKDDESCRTDDARFDGYVLWKNGENPPKVAGHTWYFIFGDADSKQVDVSEFERIVESVTPKA